MCQNISYLKATMFLAMAFLILSIGITSTRSPEPLTSATPPVGTEAEGAAGDGAAWDEVLAPPPWLITFKRSSLSVLMSHVSNHFYGLSWWLCSNHLSPIKPDSWNSYFLFPDDFILDIIMRLCVMINLRLDVQSYVIMRLTSSAESFSDK